MELSPKGGLGVTNRFLWASPFCSCWHSCRGPWNWVVILEPSEALRTGLYRPERENEGEVRDYSDYRKRIESQRFPLEFVKSNC